jgi:hypothetical protein
MILQKVQQYTGLVPRTELEIGDNDIRTAIYSQGTIGWLNDSVTQEWQNGDTELLPQDKALIQGTSLPQLLKTSQDHKLAWLEQIRLARLAYTSTQDRDEPTSFPGRKE